jgi:hypothetical protein
MAEANRDPEQVRAQANFTRDVAGAYARRSATR